MVLEQAVLGAVVAITEATVSSDALRGVFAFTERASLPFRGHDGDVCGDEVAAGKSDANGMLDRRRVVV